MRDQIISPSLSCLLVLTLVALLAVPLAAQEEPEMSPEEVAMMEAWEKASTPGEPHERLAEGVGTFKMTSKWWMDPEAEPMISEGTATRKAIYGGRYIEERVESSMMGQPFEGRGLTGYNNVTDKYWSTWIDSTSTGCVMTHGTYDEEKGEWHYKGDYADPMTGEMKTMKMVGKTMDDKEVWTFYETREGEFVKTAEIVYERQ